MSKKKEAVSPVIAVILMVAITVVLTSVLYVMVSGLVEDTNFTPHMKLIAANSRDGHNYTISMTGFTTRILLRDCNLVFTNATGEQVYYDDNLLENTTTVPTGWAANRITFNKRSDDLQLNAVQVIFVNGYGTDLGEGYGVRIIYAPTGDSMDAITLK